MRKQDDFEAADLETCSNGWPPDLAMKWDSRFKAFSCYSVHDDRVVTGLFSLPNPPLLTPELPCTSSPVPHFHLTTSPSPHSHPYSPKSQPLSIRFPLPFPSQLTMYSQMRRQLNLHIRAQRQLINRNTSPNRLRFL